MDDPLPSTPAGDTIFEETNNSTQSERDPKNDGVVLNLLWRSPSLLWSCPMKFLKTLKTHLLKTPRIFLPEMTRTLKTFEPLWFSFFIFNDNLLCTLSNFQTILSALLSMCVDLYLLICVCPSILVLICWDVLVPLVDSFSFRHDNEQALFEVLIINPSTCGLNNNNLVHLINLSTCGLDNFKASPWDELVHFVDLNNFNLSTL